MATPLRVLVHGGGIGGLTLATALARRGHTVEVIELRDEFDALGVGIIQPSNALHVMREIGVLDDCLKAGFEWEVLTIADPAGNTLAEIPQPRMDDAPSNNGIPRPALAQVLGNAVQAAGATIRFGTTITELADDGEGVDVTLAVHGPVRAATPSRRSRRAPARPRAAPPRSPPSRGSRGRPAAARSGPVRRRSPGSRPRRWRTP